jgi:multiple sugar transport system permease protein
MTAMNPASQRRVRTLLLILGTIAILIYALFPFYWMLTVSIIPEQKFFEREVHFFPNEVTISNYINLFQVLPFAKYFRNSSIVAISTVLVTLLVAIPAAYAFARFRFRGRRPLLTGLLLLYMIPPVVLLVPLLLTFRNLQLINTFVGLILAESTGTIPFGIWMLVNYFVALPRELDDAALVDGCSPLGALIRVILPLSLPGVLAAGLFVFIVTWNNFLFAFLFASGEEVKTLPVVMRSFVRGESGVFWGLIMASATLTTLPVALVFLFFQKYLIGALASGSVKG